MERNQKERQQESPSGGARKEHSYVTDAVKAPNSGLNDRAFKRFVQPFNNNDVMSSPTTSSRDCKPQEQKIRIRKGIGGRIDD